MPNRIALALDGLTLAEALTLATTVGKRCYALKVHDLVDREGSNAISVLKKTGSRIWVDYKLHDVPTTVGHRATALRDSGADIVTVHASGGTEMMAAAVASGLTVFAVTVLTSLSPEQARALHGRDPSEIVPDLAAQAKSAGCHGVVCSPKEVGLLKSDSRLQGMEFVIPGVRSPGVSVDDQKRVDTPVAALRSGATRLVIGRQVVKAKQPQDAFDSLVAEISGL